MAELTYRFGSADVAYATTADTADSATSSARDRTLWASLAPRSERPPHASLGPWSERPLGPAPCADGAAQRGAPDLATELARTQDELAALRARQHRTAQALDSLERACGRFIPADMLRLLRAESIVELELGDQCERRMTVLFCDIRDFTALSERMTPRENLAFLNRFLSAMQPVIHHHGGIVDKYIGDAIMALFPNDVDGALGGAIAMFGALEELNAVRGSEPIRMGAGMNTGLVMLGTVGSSGHMATTVISDSVNLASRLEGSSKLWKAPLIISEHTLNGLADPNRFAVRFLDRIRVKGKIQPQSLYEVFDVDPPALRAQKLATRGRFERALAYYHLAAIDEALPLLEECCRLAPEDAAAALYLERCLRYRATGEHSGTGEAGQTLAWRAEFALGVDIIDAQHQELLRRMNALSAEVRSGRSSSVGDILAFVGDYAASHFRSEEAIMARHAYPFMRDHVQEHERFVATFHELGAEIRGGAHEPLYLVFRIQVFLIDWFINHSTGTDRHLGTYLRSLGVPASGSET